MQKLKVLMVIVTALALVAMAVPVAQAAGPTGGWSSGIACQNLDSSNRASVNLTFYREGSNSPVATYDATIEGGQSRNWLTTSSVSMRNFPTNFTGSGVISSSTPLACNLNTQSTGLGTQTNPYRMGTAAGFSSDETAPVIFVPQVVKGVVNFQSYFAVQNTSSNSVRVNVQYFNADGSEVTDARESADIPAQSSKVFYQSDNAGLPDRFNGGAKVMAADGTTKLAVVVALYKVGGGFQFSQFQSYNGFAAGANKVFVPRFVRNLLGNNSGMAIQNVSNVSTRITVTFNFQGSIYTVTSPFDVAPNASWLLYAPNIAQLQPVETLNSALRQGSAVITTANTSARVVATVNEDNNVATSGNRYGHGSTYNAVNDGKQTNSVFFAQFTKNAVSGVFSSGFQVSNTTNQAGTCNIIYTAQPALNETNVTLPANGSIVRWAGSSSSPMKDMVDNYNAAVRVNCNVPVTGIVNMSAYGDKWGDSFTQTGGLNQ